MPGMGDYGTGKETSLSPDLGLPGENIMTCSIATYEKLYEERNCRLFWEEVARTRKSSHSRASDLMCKQRIHRGKERAESNQQRDLKELEVRAYPCNPETEARVQDQSRYRVSLGLSTETAKRQEGIDLTFYVGIQL